MTGHYIDAINTLKIVNESTLLALLLARDDEAAKRWERGEKEGFRPYEVRDALSKHLAQDEQQAKPLAKELGQSYGLVCGVAHPNSVSIRWIRQGARSFTHTGAFHKGRCSAVMVRLVDELVLVIPGLAMLVSEAGCEVPRDHVADLLEVLARTRSTFQPGEQSHQQVPS